MATTFQPILLSPWLWILLGGAALVYTCIIVPRRASPLLKYPLVRQREARWYDVLGIFERAVFLLGGAGKQLAAAQEHQSGQPFRMRDPWGEILVLPAEHAQYLKSHAGFAFEPFFNTVRFTPP